MTPPLGVNRECSECPPERYRDSDNGDGESDKPDDDVLRAVERD